MYPSIVKLIPGDITIDRLLSFDLGKSPAARGQADSIYKGTRRSWYAVMDQDSDISRQKNPRRRGDTVRVYIRELESPDTPFWPKKLIMFYIGLVHVWSNLKGQISSSKKWVVLKLANSVTRLPTDWISQFQKHSLIRTWDLTFQMTPDMYQTNIKHDPMIELGLMKW